MCYSCGETGHRSSQCRDCDRYASNPLSCPYRGEADEVSSNRTRSYSEDSDDCDDEVNEYPTLRSTESPRFDYDGRGGDDNESNEGVNEQLV